MNKMVNIFLLFWIWYFTKHLKNSTVLFDLAF
jgi:hypothetical protein